VVVPRLEAAAWDAAVVPRLEAAAWDVVAEPQPEAVEQAAAAVRQRAAPDVRAALPSAVPWVFRRGQPPPWPAPSPAAQLARAMERARIATP
jgi:hypothetical protein